MNFKYHEIIVYVKRKFKEHSYAIRLLIRNNLLEIQVIWIFAFEFRERRTRENLKSHIVRISIYNLYALVA